MIFFSYPLSSATKKGIFRFFDTHKNKEMAGVFIDMPGDFVIDSLSLPDSLKYSTDNITPVTWSNR